jgi:hypothetical protein
VVSTGASTSTATGLDAGTLTATSPNGLSASLSANPVLAGSYFAQLATGFVTAAGGVFGFKGSGGTGVGAFSTSVTLPTPLLAWTNQAAATTVTRSAGLSVNWTGGPAAAASSYVTITGVSTGSGVTGSFTCLAPTSAGQFTVPAYVLGALPAGSGSVTVGNQTSYSTFNATGLDLGLATGLVSYQANATFN